MYRLPSYKRNAIFLLSMLLTIVLTLSACNSATPKTEEEKKIAAGSSTIEFAINDEDLGNTLFQPILDEFEKKHSGTAVKLTVYKDYRQELLTKMAADQTPDVVMVPFGVLSQNTMTTAFLPVDDVMGDAEYVLKDTFAGMDGKCYAIPMGWSSLGILYNKKAFETYGLNFPSTLNELFDDAKQLKAHGITGLALSAKSGWTLKYFWEDIGKLYYGNGGSNNLLANAKEPFFPQSPVVKSYSLLKSMMDEKITEDKPLENGLEDTEKSFAVGKTGMVIIHSAYIPQFLKGAVQIEKRSPTPTPKKLDPSEVGFVPFPYDNSTGNKRAIRRVETGLAISVKTHNPELARELLKTLAIDKHQQIAAAMGYFPSTTPIKSDLPYLVQFISCTPAWMRDVPDSIDLTMLMDNIGLDPKTVAQGMIEGKDPVKLFGELNKKTIPAK